MRVLRRAAVFVVILVVVGAPWALAAQTYTDGHGRDHGQHVNRDSSVGLLDYLWGLLKHLGAKPGLKANPLNACPNGNPVCGGKPIDGAQTQDPEAGCTIDPLGVCSTWH